MLGLCYCRGFLSRGEWGRLPGCGAGFSWHRAQAPGHLLVSSCDSGSVVADSRLKSCGARAELLHGMWGPPRSGIKPMSPGLVDGFFTTEPPGKPRDYFFWLFWVFSPWIWAVFSCSLVWLFPFCWMLRHVQLFGRWDQLLWAPCVVGVGGSERQMWIPICSHLHFMPSFLFFCFFPVFWSCWPTATSRIGRGTTFHRLLPSCHSCVRTHS